jgi:hypothetical protein
VAGALCPITTDVKTFAAAVTVYAAPGFKPSGVKGPFAAVNIDRGEVRPKTAALCTVPML